MIRVLVVDDHLVVRRGLRQLLADAGDIDVVGDAADAATAVQQARARLASGGGGLDVVLLDIALPGRDGLDVLRQLKAEHPRLAVLMLSTYPDRQFAVRCLRAGAAGYLNKTADPDELTAALRKAAAGGVYLTASAAEALAVSLHELRDRPGHEVLSQREHQVFRLLAQGQSVGQIAQALSLSSNTVSTYRARILEKTGTRNDVELALYAVRQRIVTV
ncbi:DNA-binding response regulator [Aquabacterium olei]|uniref:DNA-binding response regulator n=1 Tax=Aquabacterium olei TaxID=1296669 RepID=A0A2U8FMC7_9BURK|nr:response regulator transcription factor [Aquabacterium olei]AWI52103.1 DNA-binding response regulator [Aquabacterium olei]